MSFCKNCGIEHTQDMIAAKMCFECGTEFIPVEDSHIDVLPVVISEDEVTFVEYEDLSMFNKQIQDTRNRLYQYLTVESNTVEDYLDMINSMPKRGYIATIQSNGKMMNEVYEHLSPYNLLEVGERLLLFVSQEKTGKNIDCGYLVTNNQIIFWDKEMFSILELWQVDKLGVNCENNIWYLNDLKDCQVSSSWCKNVEQAIIFALIFTLISKPLAKAVNQITSHADAAKEKEIQTTEAQLEETPKVEETKKEREEPPATSNQPASTSLTDKLREVKALYEEGLITESDYEETKKRILGQL